MAHVTAVLVISQTFGLLTYKSQSPYSKDPRQKAHRGTQGRDSQRRGLVPEGGNSGTRKNPSEGFEGFQAQGFVCRRAVLRMLPCRICDGTPRTLPDRFALLIVRSYTTPHHRAPPPIRQGPSEP